MNDDLYDQTGAPAGDPSVAELEQLLGAHAHRAPLRDLLGGAGGER